MELQLQEQLRRLYCVCVCGSAVAATVVMMLMLTLMLMLMLMMREILSKLQNNCRLKRHRAEGICITYRHSSSVYAMGKTGLAWLLVLALLLLARSPVACALFLSFSLPLLCPSPSATVHYNPGKAIIHLHIINHHGKPLTSRSHLVP